MNTITQILAAIEGETGLEPKPFSSRTIQELPVVTYVAYPQGDNGVVES